MTARIGVAAFAIFALSCCASSQPRQTSGDVSAGPFVPDLTGVLRIVGNGPNGQMFTAHACPLGSGIALTNTHVTSAGALQWDAAGASGPLDIVTLSDRYRDLAAVRPLYGSFPRTYQVAKDPPEVGERLWFVGYDYRKPKDAYKPRVFVVEVVNVFAGIVLYSPTGLRGSSGSCVLNARGEVVAINRGGGDLDDGNVIGMGIGVWGDRVKPIKVAER